MQNCREYRTNVNFLHYRMCHILIKFSTDNNNMPFNTHDDDFHDCEKGNGNSKTSYCIEAKMICLIYQFLIFILHYLEFRLP